MTEGKTTRMYDAEEAFYIGLNEALFLGQLRYWLERSENIRNGHKWVYNTYEGWHKQLPYLSISTLRRAINNLEEKEIIITGNYNKKAYDKTKWYALNEELLQEYIKKASVQNEQSNCSNWTQGTGQDEQTNTINYTENNNREFINTSQPAGYDAHILRQQFERLFSKLKGGYLEGELKNCMEVVSYYMEEYQKHTGKQHPLLKDEKMVDIWESLIFSTETFPDLIWDVEGYRKIVKGHFIRQYGMEIDYNICHFATKGIIEKLSYHYLY